MEYFKQKGFQKVKKCKDAMLPVVMSLTTIELIYGLHKRTIWTRSFHWWENVVLRSFGVRDCMVRISKETLHYLCQQLKPLI